MVELARDRRAIGIAGVLGAATVVILGAALWPRVTDIQPDFAPEPENDAAARLADAGIRVVVNGNWPATFPGELVAIAFPDQSAIAVVDRQGEVQFVEGPAEVAQIGNAPSATSHNGDLVWFADGQGLVLDVDTGDVSRFDAPADTISGMRVDRDEGGVWFNVDGELLWWDTATSRARAQIATDQERRHLVGVTAAGPVTHEWSGANDFVVAAFGRDGHRLWTRDDARVAAISSNLVGLWTHPVAPPARLEFVDPFTGSTEHTAADLASAGLSGVASLSADGLIASVTFTLGGFSGNRMIDTATGDLIDAAHIVMPWVSKPQFTADGSWIVYSTTDRNGSTTRLDGRRPGDLEPVELPVVITHQRDRKPTIFIVAP